VTEAVIRARHFNDAHRQTPKDAGNRRLEVLRIINEPTAAASPTPRQVGQETVLVFTSAAALRVSLLDVGDGLVE